MAINVLIDTNIWKTLVNKLANDWNLPILDAWVKAKSINILIPRVIFNEWEKHREEERKKNKEAVKNHGKDILKGRLLGSTHNVNERNYEYAEQLLNNQIMVIDEIFKNSLLMELDEGVIAKIEEFKKLNKAPFHILNQKDNTNDASLLYHSLAYLKKIEEHELYFISNNTTEFSDTQDKDLIHNDFSEAYPDIEIHYFNKLNDGVNALKSLGLSLPEPDKNKKTIQVRNDVHIDRLAHPIDQLYSLLEAKFDEFRFLPKKYFSHQFPFVIGETLSYFEIPFTANTDNELLFELLTKISIEEDVVKGLDEADILGCENWQEKIKAIFDLLTFSLVHNLNVKLNRKVPISFFQKDRSHLLSLKLGEMKFEELLEKITEVLPENLTDLIDLAYAKYQLHDYLGATDLFWEVMNRAEKEDKKSLKFIAAFNLKKLGKIIKNYYFDNPEQLLFGNKLEGLDLDEIYRECLEDKNKPILGWLNDPDFIEKSALRLREIADNIREHYFNQNGGWNTYTEDLFNTYLDLEYFFSFNGIVFDSFSEFTDLTKVFIDGLFASYACNDELKGKLTSFPEWILGLLIYHGDSQTLKQKLGHYNLSHIETNVKDAKTIIEKLIRYFNNYSLIISLHHQKFGKPSLHVPSVYVPLISNCLTLLSMIQISDDDVQEISFGILTYLGNDVDLEPKLMESIRYFFQRKYKMINEKTFCEVYKLFLLNHFFLSDSLLNTLGQLFVDQKYKLNLSQNEFQEIENKWIRIDLKDIRAKSVLEMVCDLYNSLVEESYKKIITGYIEEFLRDNFDPDIYYVGHMYGVIKFDSLFSEKYIKSIGEIAANSQRIRVYDGKTFYSDYRIDGFLNYSLKHNLPIEPKLKLDMQNQDPYYKWLLDLDNFDYTLFTPSWILHNFTSFYKYYFRKSLVLKAELFSIISKKHDKRIMTAYINIYQ